jgi:hypothetical protein
MNDALSELLNFYVLSGEISAPSLRRVPLERALQQDLTVHFESLRSLFKTRAGEHIAYDPGYHPEPGEVVCVPGFKLPPRLMALGLSAPTWPPVDERTLESERMRAVLAAGEGVDGAPLLLFQAIDARQVLRREGFTFMLSERVFRKNDRAGLVIRDALDAVFEAGTLYFSSEYVVRRFLDLRGLFEEATNQELERFFAEELFHSFEPAHVAKLSDQWVRRKVRMLHEGRVLERLVLDDLLRHAARFSVELSVRDGRLVLPRTKKELKLLLRLLDEDFLESTLSQTRYLANSKRRLSARAVEDSRPTQAKQRKLRVDRRRLSHGR